MPANARERMKELWEFYEAESGITLLDALGPKTTMETEPDKKLRIVIPGRIELGELEDPEEWMQSYQISFFDRRDNVLHTRELPENAPPEIEQLFFVCAINDAWSHKTKGEIDYEDERLAEILRYMLANTTDRKIKNASDQLETFAPTNPKESAEGLYSMFPSVTGWEKEDRGSEIILWADSEITPAWTIISQWAHLVSRYVTARGRLNREMRWRYVRMSKEPTFDTNPFKRSVKIVPKKYKGTRVRFEIVPRKNNP